MRIVLTGGGRGGHLTPFEPLLEALRTVHQETKNSLPAWIEANVLQIYFLGVLDPQSKEFFDRLGVATINIPAAKIRRYFSPRTFTDILFMLPWGMLKALWHMWRIMPDAVISKGGYGSIPVCLSAILYRVPFLVHESDTVPGLSNRLMSVWASAVTTSFSTTRHQSANIKNKTIVTGTPVRSNLSQETPDSAKQIFGFSPNDPILLIIGGSQGSQKLNDLTLSVLSSLIKDMGIIHLTGEDNLANVTKAANEILARSDRKDKYKVFGYLSDKLGAAMMAADVVITRAGATSLAELAHLRKPAIIIPLPTAAQDHQTINAQTYEVAEAARVISEENLGRSLFEQNIRALMESPALRQTLSSNIQRFDHPNAARDLATITLKIATGLIPTQLKPQSEPPVEAPGA